MGESNNHRTKRRTFLKGTGAIGAASLFGLAGCTGTPGGGGDNSYTVGVVTSLSGPFAVFGEAALAGMKLAKADLEEELGVTIEIKTADAELDPATGLKQMKRLVIEDNVDFVTGGVSSAVALKMGTWASDNKVIYMASGAHSNVITGSKCAKYMFRSTCSNAMLAETVAQGMIQEADTWYILYSDYTWGQTAYAAVKRILKNNGKTVVGASATPFPALNYSSYLNAAQASGAKGIAMLIAGLDLRKALTQFINKGMQKNHVTAMHQLEDVVLWGLSKDAASVLDIAGQVWGPAVNNEASTAFEKRIAKNDSTDPYVRHLLGYMAMDQVVRAASRAGSTDAEAMRDELEGHDVTSKIKAIKGGEKMYWRACDHQLVQPAYGVEALPPSEMQKEPYKQWFKTTETYPGGEIVRTCEETGCTL